MCVAAKGWPNVWPKGHTNKVKLILFNIYIYYNPSSSFRNTKTTPMTLPCFIMPYSTLYLFHFFLPL